MQEHCIISFGKDRIILSVLLKVENLFLIGIYSCDFSFFSKIKIPSEIGNILNMLLDVVSSISSLLKKVNHVMENLPVFLQGIQNIDVLDISALQQVCIWFQYANLIPTMRYFIRGVCLVRRSINRNCILESWELRRESIDSR